MYTHHETIRIHDVDLAGVIYFANVLRIAHCANEAFLDSIHEGLSKLFATVDFITPIVHTECDYVRPIRMGDKLTIELTLGRIGKSSYTLHYLLLGEDGELRAKVETVHVSVNKHSFEKIMLPEKLIATLKRL